MATEMGERNTSRLETILAILLGAAAVITAFAAYNASLKDGDTIKSYNQGIRSITDANGYYNEALQQVNRDEGVFIQFATAAFEENLDLRDYLKEGLMDDNLRAAIKEWEDTDILSPIEAEAYEVPAQAEAEKLEKQTNQRFAEAQTLDDAGDRYELAGVIGAVSLFFLGIGGVFRGARMRITATAIGGVVLVVAGVMTLSA